MSEDKEKEEEDRRKYSETLGALKGLAELFFNTDDFLEDNIIFYKTMIKIGENTKEDIIKNQETFAELHEKIKSSDIKKAIEEYSQDIYKQLLDLDEGIKKNEKKLKNYMDLKKLIT